MNKFFLVEYKKHIKNNMMPIVFYALIFAVCLFLNSFIIGFIPLRNEKNIKFIQSGNYDVVIESTTRNSKDFNYYKTQSLIGIKNRNNDFINVNGYVNLGQCDFIYPKKLLLENGIVISEKVAEKLKLSVGDELHADFLTSETDSIYIVETIIGYVDGLYELDKNKDFSIVVFPDNNYNKSIVNNMRGNYICFCSYDYAENFIMEGNLYNDKFEIKNELIIKSNQSIIYQVIILFINVSLIIAYFILSTKIIKDEARKYFMNNNGIKFVKKLIVIDMLIFIFIPFLFALIALTVAFFNRILVGSILFFMSILMALSLIFICLKGYFYERNSFVS